MAASKALRRVSRLLELTIATFIVAACAMPPSVSPTDNPPSATFTVTSTSVTPSATPEPSPTSELLDPVPQSQSLYLSLESDQLVNEQLVLLKAELILAKANWVLVQTDGTFGPEATESAASIYIQIDGQRVTNESRIDWRGSVDPVRHSFNAIGATELPSGEHIVELIAEPLAGSFSVSASSNLIVFVRPARAVMAATLSEQIGPFNYTTYGMLGPDLPHEPLISIEADATSPTVALASGTAQRDAHDGDAMLGIYLDGQHPGPQSSLWTVNDICTCAEVEGPLFTHALLSDGTSGSIISLDATEYPWSIPPPPREDPAIYIIPPNASLVVLTDGMQIVGKARSLLNYFPNDVGTVLDGWCIGSSSGWQGCPEVGDDVLLARSTINIPEGHSGVVMFVAKTRVQGDQTDKGGEATLWITIDGIQRGSIGVQQLEEPFSVSQRTIAASYLAAGRERLQPGNHDVEVYGRADGSFIHLVYMRDLPLLWFD